MALTELKGTKGDTQVVRIERGPVRVFAQALMDACADEALKRGGRTLWLGVWERNARAIRFYACGRRRSKVRL